MTDYEAEATHVYEAMWNANHGMKSTIAQALEAAEKRGRIAGWREAADHLDAVAQNLAISLRQNAVEVEQS